MKEITFKTATPLDFPLIQKVFDQCPSYFLKVEGVLPHGETVKQEFETRPNHISLGHKRTYLIFEDRSPMGYVDAILTYPTAESACIGLFMITEPHQRKGRGGTIYELWEKMFVELYKPNFIRLWVAVTNDVMGFWEKQGYRYEGVSKDYKASSSKVKVFELNKYF